ncbi:MAG: ATP-binding protein, partial [Syntrophus sp. (in: bacteria)]
MNLKNRFRLFIFSMVAVLASIAIIMVIGIWHTNVHIQETIHMDGLLANLYELRILNSEYLDTPSERVKQQWRTKYDQIKRKIAEQQNIPHDVTNALNGLQQIFVRLASLHDKPLDMQTSQKRLRNQLAININLESQRIIDWASDISMNAKDGIVQHLMFIGTVTIAVMLVVALFVITMMLFTARHILSSIIRLEEGAREISSGRLGFQVEQVGSDEIATLTIAINQMSRDLKVSYENLHEQTVRLEIEMAESQRINKALKIKTVELRASEERYRNIYEDAILGIYQATPEGRFISANAAFARMAGYDSPEELIDAIKDIGLQFYVNSEDRQRFIDLITANGMIMGFGAEYYKKDQSIFWILVNARAVKDDQGRIIYYEGIAADVTQLRQAEEENRRLEERLHRAEKMESLGTLAGGVAHDLNNVLGIVVGYAEMILDEVDKSSPLRSGLVNIMNGGQRAAAIVDDLLTLARRGVPGRSILNLNKIIANCQKSPEFANLSFQHPSVKIKTDIDPDLLNISGSSVHLVKSLYNLVSNACEAMTKGGVVTIKTTNQYLDKPIQGYDQILEGDYVVLSVSDTGEGISANDLKRIFEPFYTKKIMGRSGTGLGLAVVWGTAKDYNGYINVQSEEGKGSTFTIYFPVTREDISAEAVIVAISE